VEPRALKRLAGGAVLALAAALLIWWNGRPEVAGSGAARPIGRVVAPGVRIRVEVLNTSDVRGLARRATLYLREAGFDVVRFANDEARRDSTLVIDRLSHPAWAELASRALGGARIESRPDSSRFVDLTILLGATWRPPPHPLDP
jgi:hypothetical protein